MAIAQTEHNLTDAEIDTLLERFDQTERRLQRQIIALIMADRLLLLDAAREVAGALDAPQKSLLEGWAVRLLREAIDSVERRQSDPAAGATTITRAGR